MSGEASSVTAAVGVPHTPGAVWAARAYYFLFYSAVGTYFPFINLYFKQIGLSGQALGLLASLLPVAIIVASPAWGALGDRFRIHHYLLPVLTWVTVLPTLALAFTREFWVIAVLVAAAALFSSPLIPLADSAVLELVEGTPHSYGSLRVWGTPGYILLAFIMGYVLRSTGLVGLFYAFAGFATLAGIAALWLPARRHRFETGTFGLGLAKLLRQRTLVLFLLSSFLVGITFTAYNTFFGVVLQDRGASLPLISLANVLSAITEIPILFFSAALLRRLGNRGGLLMGYAVYVLRWAVLALTRSPLVMLATQALHGTSWGAVTVSGVAYAKAHSPKGLEATGQSLLSAAAAGVGAVTGALGSGWLYDHLGAEWLFTAMSLCCVVAFLVLLPANGAQPKS